MKLAKLALFALVVAGVCFSSLRAAPPPQMFGVNLAGAEFGTLPGTYGSTYIYPSNTVLDYYNSRGLKLIRVPFKWERLQPVLNGALDAAELGRITAVITAAEARGMKVILDMHNYGRYNLNGTTYIIGTAQVTRAHFKNVWWRIAGVYKSRTGIWGYGIMNEPHDMGTYTWKDSAQEAVNGIREAGDTTHAVLIPGNNWAKAQSWPTGSADLINVTDSANNRVFEAHQYFDSDQSGTYKKAYADDGATATTGVDRVKPFVDWCTTNGVKGLIGEYGIPRTDSAQWNVVLDNFLTYIKSKGISGTVWAGGDWWANNYQLDVGLRPDNDQSTQMPVLIKYGSGVNNAYYPNFTWYSDAITAGETYAYWYSFASTGATVTGNIGDTSTFYAGSKCTSIAFTIPTGGYGGGGMHIDSNVSIDKNVLANHSLTFWAKGTPGTKIGVTIGTASADGVKKQTPTLTSTWTQYKFPLSQLLNTQITATTQIPRVKFDVYPADGAAHTVYIDQVILSP
ncbi:MAG: glycoside hydrolase family 5 protein [Nibricoccus sp.]